MPIPSVKTTVATLLAASCLVVSTAMALPITFGSFNGTFPYQENGFLVTPTQTPVGGAWSGGAGGIGTAAPQNFNVGAQVGTIEVGLIGGGLFFFNYVNLRGATAEACNFSITGWLNGSTMFTDNGGLNTYTPGNPYNLINGNPSQMIDSLFITFYSNPTVNSSFNVDNIDVTPVPDSSSTLGLLGIGGAAVILLGRQQRRMAKR